MGDKLPFLRLLLRLGAPEPIRHTGSERRQVEEANSWIIPSSNPWQGGSYLTSRCELLLMQARSRRKHWPSHTLSLGLHHRYHPSLWPKAAGCEPAALAAQAGTCWSASHSPLLPTARRTPILRVRLATRLWFKVKLQNPETDSTASMALMEYLSGEWLVESWRMKEQRYKWCLCTASSRKNDKCTVVPVMMISYEWNTQVSVDAFCLLKTSPWGAREGGKESDHYFLLSVFI